MRGTGDAWLRTARGGTGDVTLVCFPHAGAGAAAFKNWTPLLAPRARVVAVQLPGREDRILEPRYERLDPLLDDLVPVLEEHLSGPVAFFGHSMGSLIAYEAARRLRDGGRVDVARLFVSGRAGPHIGGRERIGDLPEEYFLAAVRHLNGFPAEVLSEPALIRLVAPTLRADFRLCEHYVHMAARPLDCPISAFGGTGDDVTHEQLTGWRSHTSGPFRLRMLPGDHFFLMAHRAQVAEAILTDLESPLLATEGTRRGP